MAAPAPSRDGASPPGARDDRWLQKGPFDPLERAPMLPEMLAAVALLWSDAFRSAAGTDADFSFKGLRAAKVGDLPGMRTSLPIFAALRAPSWGSYLGIVLDRSVVTMLVDALFGGDGADSQTTADARPVTPIEISIVDLMGSQIAVALNGAMREIGPVRFDFDRTFGRPDPTFLGKSPTAVVLAQFELRTIGRSAAIDLIIPESVIDAQAAVFGGEPPDPAALDEAGWTRQLRSEVSRAALRVDAGIAFKDMSLGTIANLKIGQVLELPVAASSTVLLRCGDEHLFRCQLGQSSGYYTVRIDEALERRAQPPRKGR